MVNMQSSKVRVQLHDYSSDLLRSPAIAPAHCAKVIRDFIPFSYFNRINLGVILLSGADFLSSTTDKKIIFGLHELEVMWKFVQ